MSAFGVDNSNRTVFNKSIFEETFFLFLVFFAAVEFIEKRDEKIDRMIGHAQ